MFPAIKRFIFPANLPPLEPLTNVDGAFTQKKASNNRHHKAFMGKWGVQHIRVAKESVGNSGTVVRTGNPALVAKCYEVGRDHKAEREAEMICYLERKNIPHVSKLYGASCNLKSGSILIINNAGIDLEHWGRQLRLEDISRIAKEILECLVFLGEEGIVHNDIKLENICYTKEQGTFLIDWEGATFPKQGHETFTLNYLSPEVCLELTYKDENERCKRDIWAVAVVIFALLVDDGLFVSNREPSSSAVLDAIEQRVGFLPKELAHRAKRKGMLIRSRVGNKEGYILFPQAHKRYTPAFQALENERKLLVTPESMRLYSHLGNFVLDLLRINHIERPTAEEALEQHFSPAALAAARFISFSPEGAVFAQAGEIADEEKMSCAEEQEVVARLFGSMGLAVPQGSR